MHKRLKYSLYALLSLFGLLIGLLILLPFIVDPNDYKPELTQFVEEKMGRTLEIEGDLELTVFPWLGVSTGRVVLGNAPGFEDETFFAVDETQVRIKLLPLLRKDIEIGKIVINGMEVNLRRDSDGRTNWDDLAGSEVSTDVEDTIDTESERSGAGGLNSVRLDGLEIENGNFSFVDAQAGSSFKLTGLHAETGSISVGAPVEFSLGMRVTATQPQLDGDIHMETTLSLDTETQIYTLQAGNFTFAGNLPESIDKAIDARLEWTAVVFDNANQQLDVGELNFSVLGVKAMTSLVVTRLDGDPAVKGSIRTEPFSLQAVAGNLGSMMPEGLEFPPAAQASFDTDFDVDLDSQLLRIDSLNLVLADLNLQASINGEQIIDQPRFVGNLRAANFSPTRLLVNLGQQGIATTDPDVLASASLDTKFAATRTSVELTEMILVLDQSTLKGSFGIADFDKQALRFDLVIDEIDADRYLPPSETIETEAGEDAGDINATVLPVEPIDTLDIRGKFEISKLHAFSLNSRDVGFTLHASNGIIRVNPVHAKLYDGEYNGNILYRVDQGAPLLAIDERLTGVQIGGMSQDMFDENRISGMTGMQIKLRGQGKTVGEMRSSLRGKLSFEMQDGAVAGVDMTSAIKNAYAIFKGEKSEPGSTTEGKTEFAELKGSGPVRDGIWTTNDLGAEVLNIVVNGSGTVNLASEAIDLELKTTIKPKREAQEGLDIPELENVPIVIPVQCELSAPCMRAPKLDEALKAKVRQKTREKTEDVKENLKDKLKNKFKIG